MESNRDILRDIRDPMGQTYTSSKYLGQCLKTEDVATNPQPIFRPTFLANDISIRQASDWIAWPRFVAGDSLIVAPLENLPSIGIYKEYVFFFFFGTSFQQSQVCPFGVFLLEGFFPLVENHQVPEIALVRTKITVCELKHHPFRYWLVVWNIFYFAIYSE